MENHIGERPVIHIARSLAIDTIVLADLDDFEDVSPPEVPYSQKVADKLASNVFGQPNACEVTAQAIVHAQSGFRSKNNPLGSLMYLGPTGVGKTELAKSVAEVLFPDDPDSHIIKIACTSLQEASSVTRLKGADPKYVGFGGDVLIMPDAVKDGAVIIVDEVEKAHPEIWKWFMEPLDEAKTTLFLTTDRPSKTGTEGKEVAPTVLDFSKTFLIFTSNEGADQMQEARRKHTYGFRVPTTNNAPAVLDHTEIVMEALRTGRFRNYPEFLGRIGEMVVFNDLGAQDYAKIFDKFLAAKLADQARNDPKGCLQVYADTSLKQWVIDQANVQEYGARQIKSALSRTLITAIANYKASGAFSPHSEVLAYIKDGEIAFKQRTGKVSLPRKSIQTEEAVFEQARSLTTVPQVSPTLAN